MTTDETKSPELNAETERSAETEPNAKTEPSYQPAVGEAQLTTRAILVGSLVGGVVGCTNIYIGLKIGWSFGASIVSAVLGYAFFAIIGKRLSVLETNITQTAGSAAGSMASAAGLLAPIPAMAMLGYEITWYALILWSLSVSFLGIFFAVPLRRQMVEIDRLRFPTGTATAETILALVSDAGDAVANARILISAGIFAAVFTLGYHFFPQIESPPIDQWTGIGVLMVAATWGFKVYLGPSLLGAGFLIGPRVVLSLLLGAILSWAILGPIAKSALWAPGEVMSYKDGARGWLLWPGVALMVSEALTALVMSWRTFVRALKLPKAVGSDADAGSGGEDDATEPTHIPNSWWITGLSIGSVLAIVTGYYVFGIQWYLTMIAIPLSAVLAIVAVRSTGETDINPVGGMGKVTQLAYGAIAPGQISTNLMAAAITGAGASQAADMMQDLKTGNLLGASPRRQFVAQIVGVIAGTLFVVPAYLVFAKAYEIGGEKLPAPAALAWKAMAELLAEGASALPPHAGVAIAIAAVCGVLLSVLRKNQRLAPFVPSGLAVGIAFIIPAFYSLVMFYGLVVWWIWKKISPTTVEKYNFAVASGLIAGEGLMGIVNAVLTIFGVESIT